MEEILSVGGWTDGPDVAPAFGVFAEKRRHLCGGNSHRLRSQSVSQTLGLMGRITMCHLGHIAIYPLPFYIHVT
jgi:hypothetical protein